MQSLGLDIKVLSEDNQEIEIKESSEYEDTDIEAMIDIVGEDPAGSLENDNDDDYADEDIDEFEDDFDEFDDEEDIDIEHEEDKDFAEEL